MIEHIGNTPMVTIPHKNATILAKCEWFNPFGSSKDRAAAAMIAAAGAKKGDTVVEATSGNTGISLAAICAQLGLQCIIVMPEGMSAERMKLMKFYGAQVILTPALDGMDGTRRIAAYIASDCGGIYLDQFQNKANMQAHFDTTGPEIFAQCGKVPDYFVASVGTGGTITGAGRYLKSKNENLQIIAVAPAAGQTIPGIGAGFWPEILDRDLIDRWMRITYADALSAAKDSHLGCGISSGAALHAATLLADQPENSGKTIAVILADSIQRYLSTLT